MGRWSAALGDGPGVKEGQAQARSHLPSPQRCAHGPTVKGPAVMGKLVVERVLS